MDLVKMYEDDVAYYLQQISYFAEAELPEEGAKILQRFASRLATNAIHLGQERAKGGLGR